MALVTLAATLLSLVLLLAALYKNGTNSTLLSYNSHSPPDRYRFQLLEVVNHALEHCALSTRAARALHGNVARAITAARAASHGIVCPICDAYFAGPEGIVAHNAQAHGSAGPLGNSTPKEYKKNKRQTRSKWDRLQLRSQYEAKPRAESTLGLSTATPAAVDEDIALDAIGDAHSSPETARLSALDCAVLTSMGMDSDLFVEYVRVCRHLDAIEPGWRTNAEAEVEGNSQGGGAGSEEHEVSDTISKSELAAQLSAVRAAASQHVPPALENKTFERALKPDFVGLWQRTLARHVCNRLTQLCEEQSTTTGEWTVATPTVSRLVFCTPSQLQKLAPRIYRVPSYLITAEGQGCRTSAAANKNDGGVKPILNLRDECEAKVCTAISVYFLLSSIEALDTYQSSVSGTEKSSVLTAAQVAVFRRAAKRGLAWLRSERSCQFSSKLMLEGGSDTGMDTSGIPDGGRLAFEWIGRNQRLWPSLRGDDHAVDVRGTRMCSHFSSRVASIR